MLIKQIVGPKPGLASLNSTEYDIVYIQVYNNFAGVIPAGGHLTWDPAATVAQFLGFAVTRPATNNLGLYCGAAPIGIAQATWGLCQCYGVMEEGLIDGGTTDIVVGNYLAIANASFYANAPTALAAGVGWIHALEAVTVTSVSGRIFIRAM